MNVKTVIIPCEKIEELLGSVWMEFIKSCAESLYFRTKITKQILSVGGVRTLEILADEAFHI